MIFIIFLALSSYTVIDLPTTMARTAGRSSFIPILVAAALFGLAAVVIIKLNNMFLGKVFFDYSQEVIGKFFTYVIAVYYIAYFIIIGMELKVKIVDILAFNFLPRTPEIAILLFGTALFAFVAYKGITNIARLFEIYGVLFLVTTLGVCVLMIADGDKYNILPFINPSDMKEYANTMKDLIGPFGGLEILLIIPFTEKNKNAAKSAFSTLLFIGLFYFLIVECTIMTLGLNNTILLNDSFIEAVKITAAPVIERVDIFYLTIGLSSLFSGMIIVFCAITEYVCRIFPKVKRLFVALIIYIFFFILCLITINMKNIREVVENTTTYLVVVSSVLIPIIVFISAKVRRRGKKTSIKEQVHL